MLSMSSSTLAQNSLIYIGDPMCSWCYGISDELSKVWEHYPAVEKELVLGGLRPGGGDIWNDEFRTFLRHHWEDVQRASDMPFSYDILSLPAFDYDTEPACRAVTVVKALAPDRAFDFFKAVQRGFYTEGLDPKEVEFYRSICKNLDIDFDQFVQRFGDTQATSAVNQEFEYARSLGANSFPTILLRTREGLHVIAKGFATADQMMAKMDAYLDGK